MYNSFLVFDFGSNEDAAQQARHKLDGWKQAFRLDKKLLYKFDRGQAAGTQAAAAPEGVKTREAEKPKPAGKNKAATKSGAAAEAAAEQPAPAEAAQAKLLVRLYFSGHEKMTYQRWLDRIPAEEPFKSSGTKVLRNDSPGFQEVASQFDALD